MIYLDASKPENIEYAAALLKQGQLIAFPTDTLYGVGADVFSPSALKHLYEAKGRPLNKGIPILLAGTADIHRVTSQIPPLAYPLMARYWPGPLTLVLPKHPSLPDLISPGNTVAVRVPDNDVARQFIAAAGGAVATSSANRSGETPACTAAEARDALSGSVAAVLNGGPVDHGIASTILDCTQSPPLILRPGPIPGDELLPGEVNGL